MWRNSAYFFSYTFLIGKNEVHNSLTALANITNLKKLCNHPDLVYEKISEGTDGFENAAQYMPENYNKKYFTLFPYYYYYHEYRGMLKNDLFL